jgi:hypothetical protein
MFLSVENDVINIINTFTGLKLKANMKGDRTDMCKAWEDHKASGKKEERERINKLNSILTESNRIDDLKRSLKDPGFQDKLLAELVPENES